MISLPVEGRRPTLFYEFVQVEISQATMIHAKIHDDSGEATLVDAATLLSPFSESSFPPDPGARS